MSKTKSRNFAILSILILFSFVILSIGYSSINKSKAQELSNTNQNRKSLRELAQERDVEIEGYTENEAEYDLETLSKSEGIVQGKIIEAETTLDADLLYTTYTIETKRIIKPFTSAMPLEAYQFLGKPLPEPIGEVFKITRPGGLLMINGHRISQKVPGQDELIENRNYIFFLAWSGDYKTYVLNGNISGVVLIQDDLEVIPLATREVIKKSNSKFLKEGKNFGIFLETLKKKVKTTKNSSEKFLSPHVTTNCVTTPQISNLSPGDPGDPSDPGDPTPTPTPSACSAYNQCSALQGTSINAISSPFTYSINEQSLAAIPESERQDFKDRIASAAADWSQRAGVSITQAPSGQAGNVTVGINSNARTGLSHKKLSIFNVIIKLSKSSLKFSNWAFLF